MGAGTEMEVVGTLVAMAGAHVAVAVGREEETAVVAEEGSVVVAAQGVVILVEEAIVLKSRLWRRQHRSVSRYLSVRVTSSLHSHPPPLSSSIFLWRTLTHIRHT